MDTRRRSLAKGISWRALATLDTFLLSLILTNSFGAALSISTLEVLTKIGWYYVHERVWTYFPIERFQRSRFASFIGASEHVQSVTKAVSWRIIGALDTFAVSFLVTGHAGISGAIGGTEAVTKIFLYYLHERLWRHIHWGVAESAEPLPQSRLAALIELLRRYRDAVRAICYGFACLACIIGSVFLVYFVTR